MYLKWLALTLGLAIALTAASVRADLVSVASVGTLNMNANTQSGFVDVNIFDANPTGVELYGWSVGLRVAGGTSGTVTIDSASITYAPNPILNDPSPSSLPNLSLPTDPNFNTPAPGDVTVFASDADFLNFVTIPGTERGMVRIKFNASADASGTFALQLVDAGSLANTYWTDALGFNHPFNFAGSPIVGLGGAQIGTINVAGAPAVPEPSSLLLMGGAATFAGWKARRRKKQSTVAAAAPEPA